MIRLALAGALALVALAAISGARAEGDPRKGRELAIKYCARCHVVGDHNPMGGIGSTPSFQLLAKRRPDFVERFQTFYQRRPHPVYVRVPGVPAWTDLPAYATEFTITPKDIEDILAFAKTLTPN